MSAGVPMSGKTLDPRLLDTAQWMQLGGDDRIAPTGVQGLNKYGCATRPREHVLALGSSTASSVSPRGFAAADQLRESLLRRLPGSDAVQLYHEALQQMRVELRSLCGLQDMSGLDIAFAASGTDLHLLASQCLAGVLGPSPLILMMDSAETGSSVPLALRGLHFSSQSALGRRAEPGSPVGPGGDREVRALPLRGADGHVRPLESLHAEIEAQVIEAIDQGRQTLLVMLDVSKTGLLAPAPEFGLALKRRWPQALHLMVDACQFRLSNEHLRRYLEAGCAVALTGSKFLGGPTFAGALMLPAGMARAWSRLPLDPALSAHCARAELPRGWLAASRLPDVANFGLLLRWEAALAEFRAFSAVPGAQRQAFLRRFADAVRAHIDAHPQLEALDSYPLCRLGDHPDRAGAGWDAVPTIFPFLIYKRRGAGLEPLEREASQRLYLALQGLWPGGALPTGVDTAQPCYQLGQPVACGEREGRLVSALRICASARMVAQLQQDPDAVELSIAQALAALDRCVQLADQLP